MLLSLPDRQNYCPFGGRWTDAFKRVATNLSLFIHVYLRLLICSHNQQFRLQSLFLYRKFDGHFSLYNTDIRKFESFEKHYSESTNKEIFILWFLFFFFLSIIWGLKIHFSYYDNYIHSKPISVILYIINNEIHYCYIFK